MARLIALCVAPHRTREEDHGLTARDEAKLVEAVSLAGQRIHVYSASTGYRRNMFRRKLNQDTSFVVRQVLDYVIEL